MKRAWQGRGEVKESQERLVQREQVDNAEPLVESDLLDQEVHMALQEQKGLTELMV